MTVPILFSAVFLVGLFVFALFVTPKSWLSALAFIIISLLVGAFSVFGFISSFELGDGSATGWKIAYFILIAGSTFCVLKSGRTIIAKS